MTNTQLAAAAVVVSLALSVLGGEWTYGFSGGALTWLRGTSRVAPSACLIVFGIASGAINLRGISRRTAWALAAAALTISVILIQNAGLGGDVERTVDYDYLALSLTQAILIVPLACWLARDHRTCRKLMQWIAVACALGSAWGGYARLAFPPDTPLIVPQWPTRLIFLFGLCWYLHQWLSRKRTKITPLLGLTACSVEVVISFHKPILFSAFVAIVTLFAYTMWTTRRPRTTALRIAGILISAGLVLILVNKVTHGVLVSSIEQIIYEKILHAEDGQVIDWSNYDDVLENASGGRLEMWRSALDVIAQHPLLGSGLGQRFSVGRVNEHVHNWYLELLLAFGIVGALPVFAGIVWWFCLVSSKHTPIHSRQIVVPCVAYVAGIMGYNLGGSILQFFSMMAFVAFVMAVAVGTTARGRRLVGARGAPRERRNCTALGGQCPLGTTALPTKLVSV